MKKLIDKKDKIYIAGHNGMVGQAIQRSFLKNNYKNLIYASKKELDLRDYLAVKEWFKVQNPDVVIIAAAKVGGILANSLYPAEFLFDNLKIQTNLIENAFKHNVKRLLFLGSSCIYPKNSKQPIKEEYLLSGDLEKTNEWYALAKIAGIKQCSSLKIQYGFDAISLMPTNLYGPGDNYHPTNSHVLPALIRRFQEAIDTNANNVTCWGSGNPLREFLHVDDLAEACLFVLEKWKPKEQDIHYLNVGTGKDISIKELAYIISENIGFKGKIFWDKTKPDGTFRKLLDVNRINNLGWEPKIDLNYGIKDTCIDYKKNSKKLLQSKN
tara:strand:+ start:244 stop:1218 length:975 start_codon:yes stop_codon:yes gene_type:complete